MAPADRERIEAIHQGVCNWLASDRSQPVADLLSSVDYALSALTEALTAAQRELQQRIDARERVFSRFGHARLGEPCQCPYCLRDAEALGEMAANYELDLFSERQRREKAEEALTACQQERDALVKAISTDEPLPCLAMAHLARAHRQDSEFVDREVEKREQAETALTACRAQKVEIEACADEWQRLLTACRAQGEAMRAAINAMDLKMTRYGDGEWVTAYIVPAGPWHRILGLARNGQHFHSPTCYAMGPGDTEVLICHLAPGRAQGDALREFVGELADEPCSYGDNCPSNAGTRHGTCLHCKARAALSSTPKEPANG